MKTKSIKVNASLRDLLLKQSETKTISPSLCWYMGQKYSYRRCGPRSVDKVFKKIIPWFEFWNKGWLYRLTHKEPIL